jgi:hypothetical protein
MADWSLPTLTSTYANFRQNLVDRDVDIAIQFQTGTPTNTPTNAVKWDTTLNRWQKWSGTAWGELATTYALTGLTCTSFSNTGNTTLGDAAADTVTVNGNTWSFPNGCTIGGTLSFSGAITYTGNVTFGDAAGDTVTFVANTASVPAGGFTFNGGTVNFSVGLQVAGSAVLSAASTATLTNKTFDTAGAGNVLKVNGNTLSATAGTATVTIPNATDTLVGRATTDTLTNKTITAMNAASSVSDTGTIATDSVGFRGVPQNAQSAAYTLALTDNGKHISITTGGITVPANASVAFPIGATVVVFNNSATSQNIAITTDTLRLAGTTTTGTRALASYGLATLVKVAAAVWVISGTGVS